MFSGFITISYRYKRVFSTHTKLGRLPAMSTMSGAIPQNLVGEIKISDFTFCRFTSMLVMRNVTFFKEELLK